MGLTGGLGWGGGATQNLQSIHGTDAITKIKSKRINPRPLPNKNQQFKDNSPPPKKKQKKKNNNKQTNPKQKNQKQTSKHPQIKKEQKQHRNTDTYRHARTRVRAHTHTYTNTHTHMRALIKTTWTQSGKQSINRTAQEHIFHMLVRQTQKQLGQQQTLWQIVHEAAQKLAFAHTQSQAHITCISKQL